MNEYIVELDDTTGNNYYLKFMARDVNHAIEQADEASESWHGVVNVYIKVEL